MPYRRNYPATSIEVTDDNMRFQPGVELALMLFKAKRTSRRRPRERFRAMDQLIGSLSRIYRIQRPVLEAQSITPNGNSFSSHYIPAEHKIVLVGGLSIITLLHEFAHARGKDERQAVRWSVSLFKRGFPEQYAKLNHDTHCLVRGRAASAA